MLSCATSTVCCSTFLRVYFRKRWHFVESKFTLKLVMKIEPTMQQQQQQQRERLMQGTGIS
jgi:hypothetical protein